MLYPCRLADRRSLGFLRGRFESIAPFDRHLVAKDPVPLTEDRMTRHHHRSAFIPFGEEGKQHVGFVGTLLHIAQTLCESAFLRPLLEGAAKPIGVVAGVDDVRAIGDAIQDGLTQPRVRDHLGPF
jgi:hypothetical protein